MGLIKVNKTLTFPTHAISGLIHLVPREHGAAFRKLI